MLCVNTLKGLKGDKTMKYSDAYKKALKRLFELEGGLSNVEGDSGGLTYRGISYVYNPHWQGWSFVRNHDFAEADNEAMEFYYDRYWLPLKCDQITNKQLAILFFQIAVNIGLLNAIKYMQMAAAVYPDGLMGPITLAAINKANPLELELIFRALVAKHYLEIVENHDTQRKFLYGWLRRVCLT